MVIHVIFAFASVQHNGTPSRCSTVTVITTLRASVGMRSEFDITASFVIRANVKWLIHQKALSRLQDSSQISKLLLWETLLATHIWGFVFVFKGTHSGWTFECHCPKQVSIRLWTFVWLSRVTTTWWKRTFLKRCYATSCFCWACMQSADLRALSRSWASTGGPSYASQKERGGGHRRWLPTNVTTTTIDRQ